MSVPTSRASYIDCFEVLDQAIADPKGIRVRMRDYDAALHFRMRCHYARKLDRKLNEQVNPPDSPKWGLSQYDVVTLRIRRLEDQIYLYFERNDIAPTEIERLSDVPDITPEQEPEDDFIDTPVAPPPRVEQRDIERIRRRI